MTTSIVVRCRAVLAGTALMSALAACGAIPSGGEFSRLADTPISERSADVTRTQQDAVNFFAEAPLTVLETSQSGAISLETKAGEAVPRVTIGEINAAPLRFGVLLDQVSDQAGMSWRISGPESESLIEREIYFVQRAETLLETVLDELSEITGGFYRIEGDRIIFTHDRLFVARVPRMADSQAVMTEGLANLGATEIFADSLSGTISFRATRPVYENARRLVRSLEAGRDMIVYDFWIIDRAMNDSVGAGVDVNLTEAAEDAGLTLTGGEAIQGLAGGNPPSGFVSGTLGDVGVEVTARFLRSLGDTETVARPTISMLSGGTSSFSSGETTEYIREVNAETDEGTTSSGTEVETLETGVDIAVAGAHNGGVISTNFTIDISELISFEEFETGEVTLRLPRTSERSIEAHLEARPGDVMVLGGIIRDREIRSSREVLDSGVPTARSREADKTETIILVRPRLVQIRAVAEGDATAMAIPQGTGEMRRSENALGEVIEDEQRARRALERIGE